MLSKGCILSAFSTNDTISFVYFKSISGTPGGRSVPENSNEESVLSRDKSIMKSCENRGSE